jgi:hypothetical protein
MRIAGPGIFGDWIRLCPSRPFWPWTGCREQSLTRENSALCSIYQEDL